jgi:hypothetical protein
MPSNALLLFSQDKWSHVDCKKEDAYYAGTVGICNSCYSKPSLCFTCAGCSHWSGYNGQTGTLVFSIDLDDKVIINTRKECPDFKMFLRRLTRSWTISFPPNPLLSPATVKWGLELPHTDAASCYGSPHSCCQLLWIPTLMLPVVMDPHTDAASLLWIPTLMLPVVMNQLCQRHLLNSTPL